MKRIPETTSGAGDSRRFVRSARVPTFTPTSGREGFRSFGLVVLLTILAAASAGSAGAQELEFAEEAYCIAAVDYLTRDSGYPALVDPDTIQDWRSQQVVPGCRVYAAGATELGLAGEATSFYQRLLSSGWMRTPDPYDAPNEASIRLRLGDVDCLYHVYDGPLIETASEIAVSRAVALDPGETRYHVLVQCMPAMDAAPR